MGDTKLEISGGRATEDPPPQSYKTVSESDTEETALKEKEELKKTMSKEKKSIEADGADEQMLENETKALTEDAKIDIVEGLNDKQNGEAKLSIEASKPAFVGMGKEELMKFANDPFWVRLRWILFIAFWLIWLALLVGAIIIIATAPKCAPPKERTWWEKGIMAKFQQSHDIDTHTLDKLVSNKINTIIIQSPQDSYKTNLTGEYLKEMVEKIKMAKDKNINVIIGLNPIESDEFRYKSESSQKRDYKHYEKYDTYYVWLDAKETAGTIQVPPNNWKSRVSKEESAWEWKNTRQKFLYKPGYYPALNLTNLDVIAEFVNVLKTWMAVEGVKGFELSNVPYMFVGKDFTDESPSRKPGPVHTERDFWMEKKTKNLDGIGDVLLEWRNHLKELNPDAVFMLSDDLDTLDTFTVNGTLTIDLPKHSSVFSEPERRHTASHIFNGTSAAFNIIGDYLVNWPLWNYNNNQNDENNNKDDDHLSLNLLTMLLPGTVIVDPTTKDPMVDPMLINIRDNDAIKHGSYHQKLLANNSVFAYQRVQAGKPGYIVAYNPTENDVTVNFTELEKVSEQVTYQMSSSKNDTLTTGDKISSTKFVIESMTAVVVTYVPQS